MLLVCCLFVPAYHVIGPCPASTVMANELPSELTYPPKRKETLSTSTNQIIHVGGGLIDEHRDHQPRFFLYKFFYVFFL